MDLLAREDLSLLLSQVLHKGSMAIVKQLVESFDDELLGGQLCAVLLYLLLKYLQGLAVIAGQELLLLSPEGQTTD